MQSFSQFANSLATIRALFYLNPRLSDAELNAIIGLAYIYGQINIIEANPSYVPQNEFDLLNHIMNSLPEDHALTKRIKPLLSLIESYINKKDIGNPTTPLQDTKQISLNAQDVIKILKKHIDDLLEDDPLEDNLLERENCIELLEQTQQMLTQSKAAQPAASVIPNKNLKESNSIAIDVNTVEPIQSLFYFYIEEGIPLEILTQIIECLLSNSINKRDAIQKCLKAYQMIYDDLSMIAGRELNIFLRMRPTLFELFNRYLQPEELQRLITASPFDPAIRVNNIEYFFYIMGIAIILGKEIQVEKKLTLNIQTGRYIFNYLIRKYPFKQDDFQNFIEWTSGPGKIAAEASKLIQQKELLYLPPAMQLKLQQLDKNLADDFLKFLNKYQEINKRAEPFHQRPIALFLAKLDDKIIQLIDIMGRNGIAYMNQQIVATVLPLERMLENLPSLDESLIGSMQAYYSKQKQREKHDSNINDSFYNCLIAAGMLSTLHLSDNDPFENPIAKNIMPMSTNKSPSEFLQAMVSEIIKKILPGISIDISEQQITEMFNRISPERFAKLAIASQKMQHHEYREIYLHLLKLDLTGGDIDGFLHKTTRKNPIGNDLSQHNRKIRRKLAEHKIVPKDALNYQKTYDFIVTSTTGEGNSIDNMRLVLWGYLQQLDTQIATLQLDKFTNPKHQTRLKAIQKYLTKIKESIKDETQSQVIAAKLATQINEDLINKILQNIVAFESDKPDEKAALPPSFIEFANHVRQQFESINSNKAKEKESEKKKQKGQKAQYYFSVEQWPKERAETFFLGDEVGCCLATNGAQFQAMVQRRMDDAMLFHVVVDKDTGKPAALAWLYLAESHDGKIVLIANFFEVNIKYGNNPALRIPLLNGILKFTELYLKDNPAIDGFYMNRLTYGWNTTDLSSYPIKPFKIVDKLGGAFVPGENQYEDEESKKAAYTMTIDKYYLVSLLQNQFHQFDPDILAKEATNNALPLQDIIQKTMATLIQKELKFEEISAEIIKRHRIELEHFYSNPLEKCDKFMTDMKKWYSEIATATKAIASSPKDDSMYKISMFNKPPTPTTETLTSPESQPAVKKT